VIPFLFPFLFFRGGGPGRQTPRLLPLFFCSFWGHTTIDRAPSFSPFFFPTRDRDRIGVFLGHWRTHTEKIFSFPFFFSMGGSRHCTRQQPLNPLSFFFPLSVRAGEDMKAANGVTSEVKIPRHDWQSAFSLPSFPPSFLPFFVRYGYALISSVGTRVSPLLFFSSFSFLTDVHLPPSRVLQFLQGLTFLSFSVLF